MVESFLIATILAMNLLFVNIYSLHNDIFLASRPAPFDRGPHQGFCPAIPAESRATPELARSRAVHEAYRLPLLLDTRHPAQNLLDVVLRLRIRGYAAVLIHRPWAGVVGGQRARQVTRITLDQLA